MSSAFAALKKRRGNNDELYKKIKADTEKKDYTDSRLWQYTRDEAGNCEATFRFLPPPIGEDYEYVKTFSHGFKNSSGKWFIDTCPTTMGNDCAVCSSNKVLWNESNGDKSSGKLIVRGGDDSPGRKRNVHYYANILIIDNPSRPEDNGKVFLFKYGKTIQDIILTALKGVQDSAYEDDNVPPQVPFDFWEGMDFRFKVTKKEGRVNYETSRFLKPSELFDGDDKKLDALYNKLYPLKQFETEPFIKTTEFIENKFNKFMGVSVEEPKEPKRKFTKVDESVNNNKPDDSWIDDKHEEPKNASASAAEAFADWDEDE